MHWKKWEMRFKLQYLCCFCHFCRLLKWLSPLDICHPEGEIWREPGSLFVLGLLLRLSRQTIQLLEEAGKRTLKSRKNKKISAKYWYSIVLTFFLFFSTSVCVYRPPREVEWSACSASTKDQVRIKTLALIESGLLDGKCPEGEIWQELGSLFLLGLLLRQSR